MNLDDTIATLVESLRANGATTELITKTVADIRRAAKEEKDSKPSTKAAKTRLAILLRSDDPKAQAALAGGGWIVSVPDGESDPSTLTYSSDGLIKRLQAAVVAHNEAPRKGRAKSKPRIETWFQAFTQLRSKTIKESGSAIGVKMKGQPAEIVVLTSENVAP